MYFCFMIVVTGAAGFIGSCLVSKLNNLGINLIRGAWNPDKLGIKEKGGTLALRAMLKVLKSGLQESQTT